MISIHHRPDQIGGRCPMLKRLRCTTLTFPMMMRTHAYCYADLSQRALIMVASA